MSRAPMKVIGLAGVLLGVGIALLFAPKALRGLFVWDQTRISDQNRVSFKESFDRVALHYGSLSQTVQKHAIWSRLRKGGDSGSVLGSRVPWGHPERAPSHLSAEWLSRVDSWKTGWVQHSVEPELKSIDFSWFAEIREASHWDLSAHQTPFRESVSKGDPAQLVLPAFGEFSTWGRLRLLRGIQEGDILRAEADVSQLAWLLVRTDLFAATATAAAILNDLAVAGKTWKASHPETSWEPLHESFASDVTAWALALRSMVWAPGDLDSQVLGVASSPTPGVCSILAQRALRFWTLKRYRGIFLTEPRKALEKSLSDFGSVCPAGLAKLFLEAPAMTLEPREFFRDLMAHPKPFALDSFRLNGLHFLNAISGIEGRVIGSLFENGAEGLQEVRALDAAWNGSRPEMPAH